MEDALRSVPGITFQAGEGGQQGDSPIINGFVARGDIFRDGIRDPGWYTRDLFSSDRVEVYKGPSAFAFGRGTTGGAINIVSKLPTGASFVETVGHRVHARRLCAPNSMPAARRTTSPAASSRWARTSTRATATTSGPSAGASRRRLPIDVTNQTKVTLAYVYQGEESIPDYGHPYLPAPVYSPPPALLTNGGYYGNGTADAAGADRRAATGSASSAARSPTSSTRTRTS